MLALSFRHLDPTYGVNNLGIRVQEMFFYIVGQEKSEGEDLMATLGAMEDSFLQIKMLMRTAGATELRV